MSGWIAGAIAGSAVIGGIASSSAAKTQAKATDRASALQADAASYSADLQNEQYQQTRTDQKPFMEGGYNALARQQQLLGLGADQGTGDYGKYGRDFGMSDFQQDPGYGFRLSEGQKALDRSAAARGGTQSGSALKAATRYGQDMGSQEYQNAFSRYQTNRANQLNPLQSIAGQGQTTASNLGAAGANMANSVGNIQMGAAGVMGNNAMSAGNARASGYMGAANALSSGLGTYLNYNQNQSMMSMMNKTYDQNQNMLNMMSKGV